MSRPEPHAAVRRRRPRRRGGWIIGPILSFVLCLPLSPTRAEDTAEPPPLAVEILGLQGEPLENVRAGLALLRSAGDPQLDAARIQKLYQDAPAQIRRALEPFGYYRPKLDSSLERPAGPGEPWQARFDIDAGMPLPIAELDLELGEAAGILAGVFPLALGDPLDHRLYKQGKQELLRRARAAGYLKAELTRHRIEVNPAAYRATVRLTLEPGPLHRFCGLTFEQEGFQEDYLRAFIPMQKGDPYTQDGEAELRRALVASGHFRRVEIERLAAHDDAPEVYLLVQLEAHKRNRYRARFGWGTDTGFGLHFDWTRRNLWNEGHQLNIGTVVVQERAKLVGEVNYSIPSDPLFNQRIELFARHQGKDLSALDAGVPEVESKTRILNNTLGLRLPRPRRLWGGLELEESLSVTLLTESYDVFDMLFGDLSDFIQDQIELALGDERETLRGDYQGLVLGADWTYRTMDDPLNARRGDYLRLSLKGAHKSLGSNFDLFQAHLKSASIRPIGDGRLILRGEAAYSLAETEVVSALGNVEANQIPELYEFRTGGDRSVRGYKYEELLPNKSFTGGKHLWVGSVEYDYSVIPNWSAAVFIDAGSAFNRFDDIDAGVGIGVGARWRSPVGPVRLDLAVPLTDAESPFRIHITIGPEF